MAPRPSIFVGVDFGTTYSGIAWAMEGSSPDDIEVISQWPGGDNRTSLKVPSIISYNFENTQWGYQVGPFKEAFRGIKLLLDEDQETKYKPSLASKNLLSRYGTDAVRVTADYLEQLTAHAKKTLERRFGIDSTTMDIRYILTVPAVWSHKAQNSTLRAALRSGISSADLSLISEPEAAALYALRSMQAHTVKRGDVVIVCDAGGGTVDLISYRIKRLEPLGLIEVTEGTGGICGSMILDQRFEELLKDRIGHDDYAELSEKSKETAISYWRDKFKPNFTGTFDDEFAEVGYFIPLPGVADDTVNSIEDGFIELSSEDVAQIFDPIIHDVQDLVSHQVKKIRKLGYSTEAIVLVGGFGSSEYLFHRLQAANPAVTIIQPPNAWSAVVSGAVQRGVDGNKVESRIARRHYGVECSQTYDPVIHDRESKWWSSLEEKYFATGQMRWHIRKSATLDENRPAKIEFQRTVELNGHHDFVFFDDLYFCNDDLAPSANNERIMRLCSLRSDLSEVPRELFKTKKNSKGVEYYEIEFDLVMTPTSASLLFELQFHGVPYGSVSSKY